MKNGEKTHCPRGHPYEGHNLIVKKNGTRQCRACAKMQRRHHDRLMRDELARIRAKRDDPKWLKQNG